MQTIEINIGDLNEYLNKYNTVEIETDTGFYPIKNFNEKGKKQCYKLIFEDDFELNCSYDHFIQDVGDNWWSPENLIAENDMFPELLFQTKKGYKQLLKIIDIGEKEIVDLEVDNENHRYYTNGILSHNSGKSLLSISGAMKLIRKKQYGKIVYVRNSIESLDRGEDIGYLAGNEEKFKIYNHPLMDSIEFIVRKELKKTINNKAGAKESDITQTTVESKIEETIKKYDIETLWTGEARGRTISDAVVILDEAQNMSNKTMQLVLTRIDSSCKVIILGSNLQIDNYFINKHTNGLTTLLNATQKKYDGINLFSIKLNKVLRGPITEWAENIFSGQYNQ